MRHLGLSVPLALLAAAAPAQCFETNFGTQLATAAQLFGDVQLPGVPLGFPFPFGGTTYSDVHVADKGYVYLSNAGVPPVPAFTDFTATAAELATGGPRIAALWSDLQAIGTNGGMLWLNSSVPGRAVITWENVECFGGNCPQFDMQLQLFANGSVFVFWGPGATNNSDPGQPTWQAGVVGASPGSAAVTPPSVDLSVGGFTIDPVVLEEWLQGNTFDMASRGLQLVPASPGWVYSLPSGCASAEQYGAGCVQQDDSIYEEWLAGFDLNNSTVTWLRSGTGYVVTKAIPGAFVPPTPAAVNVASGLLDGQQLFPLSVPMPAPGGPAANVVVTTKGQIMLTGTLPPVVDFSPSVAELLADPATVFVNWHDYDQTDLGSGLILWEELGGIAYATWNGVHSYSSSTPSTFQFQLNLATGDVTLVIQTMGGFANPDPGIIGYSVAGPSPDPGPTDLSALTGTVLLGDVGVASLALSAIGLPQIGNAGFGFETTDVPVISPVGILFFGATMVSPPLDLTFLGMPGCFAHTDGQLGSATFPVASGMGTVLLPIPGVAALVGTVFTAQSVAFSTATPASLISSNGLKVTVGN